VRRLEGSGDRYYPHWSPDGRYLAATADHCKKVVFFDFKSQSWVKLAEGDVYNPIWSHDGQSLCFINWAKQGYYRVSIRSRRLERITDLETPLPIVNGIEGGGWVGIAPDDSPIALFSKLEVGHNEVYALDWVAP
jgi:Tol biopolymer transport system component